MMVVLGLGNPGRSYANSRHNVGVKVVERLAHRYGIRLGERRRHVVLGQGSIMETDAVLARSRTYVNLSGVAALYLMDRYHVAPSDLLVAYDDMDLSVGTLRIRAHGSSAGHKGIKSIIDELHTREFPRLRIGVGHPRAQGTVGFVLGRFAPEEAKTIDETIDRAVEAVACIAQHGLEAAMNKYNRRSPLPEQETNDL